MLTKGGLITLSAMLYAAAFPPTSLRFLAWIALVPLLAVLVACRSGWRAGWTGAVWALLMTLFVGRCLPPAVELFHEQSLLAGWLLLMAAGLLTAVPHYALFAVVFHALANRHAAGLPLLTGAAWAAAEWARVELPPGNPWAIAGLATVDMPELAGLARVTGVYGLSFLVVTINATVLLLLQHRRPWRTRRQAMLASFATLVAAMLLATTSRPISMATARTPGAIIALVQPALPPDSALSPGGHQLRLQAHLDLTAAVVDQKNPDLVLWPESSLGFFLEEDGPWRSDLQIRAPLGGAELIAGGPRRLPSQGVANSLFLLGPEGWPSATYDKQVLLPLGEWFPANSSGLLRRDLGAAPQTYTTGEISGLIPSAAGKLGPAICNEIMIPRILRQHVRNGAGILLNPANDAWFPDAGCPLGLFDIARMRAIEHGRWLVRVSSSGPSAFINSEGEVVAKVPIGETGWTTANVPQILRVTPYTRWGDVFGLLSVLAVVFGLARRPVAGH